MIRLKRVLLLGSLVAFSSALPFPGISRPENQAVLDQASGIINTVAQKALPAVVSITTIKEMTAEEQAGSLPMEPFGLFGQPPAADNAPKRAVSVGSGVVIDRNEGLILTNNHVIEGAERITITF